MSERGLLLALQRIHDDPGFTDRVDTDPEGTLGLYDLDQQECDTLIAAVKNDDHAAIRQMAERVGVDWTADHIGGIGALSHEETSIDEAGGGRSEGSGALPGDGYEGVMPVRPPGA
jgi:hypothetical protein